MIALKRCPFCGGKAELTNENSLAFVNEKGISDWLVPYIVGCDDCGARTFKYMRIEDAINAWNRRANEYTD